MARWKLFNKSKTKKEKKSKKIDINLEGTEEGIQQEKEISPETSETTEETPITEYDETLYSKGHPKKKDVSSKKKVEPWRRKSWENIDTIEKNINDIDKKEKKGSSDYKQKSSDLVDVEKKVDKLLKKYK